MLYNQSVAHLTLQYKDDGLALLGEILKHAPDLLLDTAFLPGTSIPISSPLTMIISDNVIGQLKLVAERAPELLHQKDKTGLTATDIAKKEGSAEAQRIIRQAIG